MTLFPDTNEALISKVKDLSDESSWAEFAGLYQPAILRMAVRRGLQDADAQDVIQQVLLSVAKSIDGWSPVVDGPPFRVWLATLARNAITNALSRKPPDRAVGGTSVIDQLDSLSAPSSLHATRSELDAEIRYQTVLFAAEQIRHEFSDDIWHCFWKTAVEGKSIQAVAAEMKRSSGSIYVGRFRIAARIREKVRELSSAWKI